MAPARIEGQTHSSLAAVRSPNQKERRRVMNITSESGRTCHPSSPTFHPDFRWLAAVASMVRASSFFGTEVGSTFRPRRVQRGSATHRNGKGGEERGGPYGHAVRY